MIHRVVNSETIFAKKELHFNNRCCYSGTGTTVNERETAKEPLRDQLKNVRIEWARRAIITVH